MTERAGFAGGEYGIGAVARGKSVRGRYLWWVPFILTVFGGALAYGSEAITGQVVDGVGHPVAGALVGSSFSLSQAPAHAKVQIGYGQPAVVSNPMGVFLIPADTAATIEYSKVLVAAGPDGSLGYAAKIVPGANQIRLREPARLTLRVTKRFGHSRTGYAFDLLADGSAIGYGTAAAGSSTFLAPAGSVELSVSDTESVTAARRLNLIEGTAAEARVELQPTLWAKHIGKPAPPLIPTDLENWPAGQSLQALRGKWVLVDFWATWCQPCVAEMPRLINFYQEHAADRSRFEIIAIHSPDGKSFSAIHDPYERLRQRIWSGQALPFPLLFDATGATQKAWGVETYPTMLLIDPTGQLLGESGIDELANKIGL